MNDLTSEKVMTVKEVAEAMGVSNDTIKNCIRRIMPDKMANGKTTYLNEKEVASISKELKANNTVTDRLTYEVSSQVKSTTTDLEILANYKLAQEQFTGLLERKNAELQQLINEQAPKVEFYDKVTASDTSLTMNEVAKVLDIGRNNLFKFLREEKILMHDNLPYQKYAHLFEVREYTVLIQGKAEVKTQTLVKQKGVDFIQKKMC